MRAVRSKDTKPEMDVRRLVHAMGFRFRLHRADLPGKPDLAFPGRKRVIFVHGCFWHGHNCKRGARVPQENRDYWLAKVGRNRERDAANLGSLTAGGWEPMVVWECEVRDKQALRERLSRFLMGNECGS